MIKSLVNSVADKYAAATNPQAGNEDDAFASRFQSVVTIAKRQVEEEQRLATLPVHNPPQARNDSVMGRPHLPPRQEKGNMEKGNANTSEIKCYVSLDELKNVIAEETARRLEPERLLGEHTKETTLLDGGRVEVIFSTSGSALGSTEG